MLILIKIYFTSRVRDARIILVTFNRKVQSSHLDALRVRPYGKGAPIATVRYVTDASRHISIMMDILPHLKIHDLAFRALKSLLTVDIVWQLLEECTAHNTFNFETYFN